MSVPKKICRWCEGRGWRTDSRRKDQSCGICRGSGTQPEEEQR